MTEISQNAPSDASSSFPKELYMVFALAAGCITFGAYKRGQLDEPIQKAKTAWTEMTASNLPADHRPVSPNCENTP